MSDSITFLGTSDGLPPPDRHHLSRREKLADFLEDKPVKRVALTLLSRQARERLPEVRALFPNAVFANDGQTIEF